MNALWNNPASPKPVNTLTATKPGQEWNVVDNRPGVITRMMPTSTVVFLPNLFSDITKKPGMYTRDDNNNNMLVNKSPREQQMLTCLRTSQKKTLQQNVQTCTLPKELFSRILCRTPNRTEVEVYKRRVNIINSLLGYKHILQYNTRYICYMDRYKQDVLDSPSWSHLCHNWVLPHWLVINKMAMARFYAIVWVVGEMLRWTIHLHSNGPRILWRSLTVVCSWQMDELLAAGTLWNSPFDELLIVGSGAVVTGGYKTPNNAQKK